MMEDLIPQNVLEKLKKYDTATVANAIEQFKVRDQVTGYASTELVCQYPDYNPIVGYAITCTGDTTTAGEQRPMKLDLLLDEIDKARKPAVLVIKYMGSERRRSCFVGDMICAALQKMGVVAVVTDGGYRDQAGIAKRAPGFQVFSPGKVASHGRSVFIDINISVSVCGMTIKPGDLLHGDANGLISVPKEIAKDVVRSAESTFDTEADYFKFLKSGQFSLESLKKRICRH